MQVTTADCLECSGLCEIRTDGRVWRWVHVSDPAIPHEPKPDHRATQLIDQAARTLNLVLIGLRTGGPTDYLDSLLLPALSRLVDLADHYKEHRDDTHFPGSTSELTESEVNRLTRGAVIPDTIEGIEDL